MWLTVDTPLISVSHKTHRLVHLLGLPVSDFEPARLVVQAVGARDQLAEGTRPGEPRLLRNEKAIARQ